jgi:phospholipid/cholesterol/gamma-HCH transport system substrate-binding protein
MESNVNYTVVGGFVVSLTCALIVIALWLSIGLSNKNYNFYYAYMNESVSGLNVDSPVKYNGVNIGTVKKISLNPHNLKQVRLLLAIQEQIPIKTDTIATLVAQGLTGISYVNLSGGDPHAPLLMAVSKNKYPIIQTKPSIRFDSLVSDVTQSLSTVTHDLHALFSKENLLSVHNILAHVDKVTEAFSQNPEQLSEAGRQLPIAIKQLSIAMQSGQAAMQMFSNQALPQAIQTLNSMQSLSTRLDQLTSELEQNPSMLIRGRKPLPAGPGE